MAKHPNTRQPNPQRSAFEDAAHETRPSLLSELTYFLAHSKKWWLLPILVVLGLLGVLAMFSATGVAPFIYTLF